MSNTQPMQFTVKRSEWYRGQGYTGSRLLREQDRKRCCLGFLGRACGIGDNEMLDVTNPWGTKGDPGQSGTWHPGLFLADVLRHFPDIDLPLTNTMPDIMATLFVVVNDSPDLDGVTREETLTRLFRHIGIEVEFVD